MKNMINLPLTIVFVQDPVDKGYTVFAKQIPNIIAEGDNEDDALNNFLNTVHDAFKHVAGIYKEECNSGLEVFEKEITLKAML